VHLITLARAWLLGPRRREHIERASAMAGDLIFNNAAIEVTVAAVNIYGNPAEVSQRLDQIDSAVQSLLVQGVKEMATLDDLVQAAQDESTVDDSIIALVTALKASVDAAGGNQAKIDAAFAAITGNAKKVADAVVANTPAADTGTGSTGGDTTGGTPTP
jgi:hypothetical protein